MPRSLGKAAARLEQDERRRRRDSFAKWRRYVDAVDFLENLDIANITDATSEQIQFSCPFPDHTRGDEHPSAFMNNGSLNPHLTTAWRCFGCGRSGTAISFLAEYENISKQEAASLLKAHYARGYIAPRYGSISKEFEERYARRQVVEPTTLEPLDGLTLRRFDVDWGHYAEEYGDYPDVAYMLDRGFTPATLDDWGIGYDHDSQRITIPVCDADGNLVGFKGRAWKQNVRPKYLVLGDKGKQDRYGFRTFDKSLVVFGLDRVADSDSQSLVLVEGELDVISLWCMGIAAICTGGSSMSTVQARLIRQYADELVLFFDNDVAGRNAIHGIDNAKTGEHKPGILELLEPFLRVRVVGKHRHDANDYLVRGEHERVRRLIAGAKPSHLL